MADTADMATMVEVDERGRVTLSKALRGERARYLASVEPDGTIVLRPAVVMSELEARLMTPALVERVEANRADPSRMVRRRRKA